MATRKPKQLTAADLSSLNSALDSKKAIRILNNKYEVLIDTHFRETKLIQVATKYLTILQDLNKKENIKEETIVSTISLLPTLIIAEFSNVPVELDDIKTIEELIKVQNALIDTNVLKEVFDQFDKTEIDKVTEKMTQISNDAGRLIGELSVKDALKDVGVDGNNELEAVRSSDQ